MTAVLAAAMLLAPFMPQPPVALPPEKAIHCQVMWVTGYVRTEFSGRTYDGTSVYTDEPIAAASWWIPIDAKVQVEGIGTFRVADRGHLGPAHVDIAVWTRSEAFALTGYYNVCVYPPV